MPHTIFFTVLHTGHGFQARLYISETEEMIWHKEPQCNVPVGDIMVEVQEAYPGATYVPPPLFCMLYAHPSVDALWTIGTPPRRPDKHEFLRLYPQYEQKDGNVQKMLQTSLTLPEIQVQVARALKTHDLTQEEKMEYTLFLFSSQAPSGIAFRNTGEKWILLHASVAQLHAHNIFIPNVRDWGEERSVAPLSKFEHSIALQKAHIAYETTWESELPESIRCCGPFHAPPL